MIKLTGTSEEHVSGIRRFVSCCVAVSLATLCTVVRADDITYGYDAVGHLTSVSVAGVTACYDYDAAGNITAIRRQEAVSVAAPVSGAESSRTSEGVRPLSRALSQASVR